MNFLMIFLTVAVALARFFASVYFITQAVYHFRDEQFILFGFDITLAVFFLAMLIKAVVS